MHNIALHCTALQCTALYCTALHFNSLQCSSLHYIVLHSIELHYTELHCFIDCLGQCSVSMSAAEQCSDPPSPGAHSPGKLGTSDSRHIVHCTLYTVHCTHCTNVSSWHKTHCTTYWQTPCSRGRPIIFLKIFETPARLRSKS